MATNDNVRQRKKEESPKSEPDAPQSNWGPPPNGNVNSWNDLSNLPGPSSNGFVSGSGESAGQPSGSSQNQSHPPGQGQGQPDPQAQPSPYKTANEYAQAVQQWLWQYQCWNQMNMMYSSFPMYAMSCWPGGMQQPQPTSGSSFQTPGSYGAPPPGVPPQSFFGRAPPVIPQAGGVGHFQRPTTDQRQGTEYRIPSLWKRVFAEFIDFLLLFLVKLAVTILTVEYVGIVDIQKYDLDYLLNQNLDYNAAFAMTSELVAMEVINRIFICIFETLCLRKGVAGSIGGTTPGKKIMGLRVVSCEDIVEFPGRRIRVTPAQDIGFWNALVRSVIKNFSLAFFFPVCFTVFFFQHNRAAYDIIANCIVVEPLREDWPRRR